MTAKGAAYRLAQRLSRRLPPAAAFRCAERVADLWACVAPRERAAIRGNLSLALGTPAPEAALVREVFRNFGRYLVEFFTIHQTPRPTVAIEGYEHLLEARRHGRGVVLLTGHLGNWELGAVLLRRLGFPVAVVALPHDDADMDRLFTRQRQRCGLEVIPVGRDAARRSLQRLREGCLLGLLGDREFGGHGVSVRAFRREMVLPRGPAILSLRARAPVLPVFLIREGRWAFRLCLEPALQPDDGPGGGSPVQHLIQRYARILERYVQRAPAQWLLFQPIEVLG